MFRKICKWIVKFLESKTWISRYDEGEDPGCGFFFLQLVASGCCFLIAPHTQGETAKYVWSAAFGCGIIAAIGFADFILMGVGLTSWLIYVAIASPVLLGKRFLWRPFKKYAEGR